MLAFIPFLIQENLSIEFIKNNKIVLLGLLSITLYCVYPTTAYGGLVAMFLIGLLISSILYLQIRRREEKYLYIFLLIFIVGWSVFVSLMVIWFYGEHIPSILTNL